MATTPKTPTGLRSSQYQKTTTEVPKTVGVVNPVTGDTNTYALDSKQAQTTYLRRKKYWEKHPLSEKKIEQGYRVNEMYYLEKNPSQSGTINEWNRYHTEQLKKYQEQAKKDLKEMGLRETPQNIRDRAERLYELDTTPQTAEEAHHTQEAQKIRDTLAATKEPEVPNVKKENLVKEYQGNGKRPKVSESRGWRSVAKEWGGEEAVKQYDNAYQRIRRYAKKMAQAKGIEGDHLTLPGGESLGWGALQLVENPEGRIGQDVKSTLGIKGWQALTMVMRTEWGGFLSVYGDVSFEHRGVNTTLNELADAVARGELTPEEFSEIVDNEFKHTFQYLSRYTEYKHLWDEMDDEIVEDADEDEVLGRIGGWIA